MAKVYPYEAGLHSGEVSRAGACAQGGRDTCNEAAEFSVLSDEKPFNMAACARHLAGAVRSANDMEPRPAPRSW